MALAQCYAPCALPLGPAGPGRPTLSTLPSLPSLTTTTTQISKNVKQQYTKNFKDYTQPLHVDCSVEYELPNAAKPPPNAKSEPLLMIHPSYYRLAESQRRSPFVNNLPRVGTARRTRQAAQPYPTVRVDSAHPVLGHTDVMSLLWPEKSRDPLLCGANFSSSSDSGISLGHWTDSDRSPSNVRTGIRGPDSGVGLGTPDAPAPCPCLTAKHRYSNTQNSQMQLQQWLQSVQVTLSPQRKSNLPSVRHPQPPYMLRYGLSSPLLIH